jgi:thiol-disulfide isomerase/thioredoxin
MNSKKQVILGIVIAFILGAIFYIQSQKPERASPNSETPILVDLMSKEEKAKMYEPAHEISSPDGFINIPKITIAENIGKKVILVDFWTYSCINCQRTIPYLNSWYEKYADKGLVIIGVHTPEFQFEQKYENVEQAVKKFAVQYPVVLDNDYSTWTAYKNRYWPRKYLIDIDGFIVYDHIGEGAYEETEKKIQELLKERITALGINDDLKNGIVKPSEAPNVDFSKVGSPEVYFGASRNELLGNGQKGVAGFQMLENPEAISSNVLYLVGDWEFEAEYAKNRSPARIIFRYTAKDVYFVASAETAVKVNIILDGKPISKSAGSDVKIGAQSSLLIKDDQLYKIVEGSNYEEHTLELLIENPGLKAFTFTFG